MKDIIRPNISIQIVDDKFEFTRYVSNSKYFKLLVKY